MSENMVITGAEWVVFGVEDMEGSRRFLELYGLEETPNESGRSGWRALDGSGVELRLVDDPSLPEPVVPGPTGRLYVWGVQDQRSLDAIKAELSKDRPCEMVDGMLRSVDDDGHAIAFRITRRTSYEAEDKVANVPGLPSRRPVNQRVDFKNAGKARQLGHLVFWTRDPERSFAFYRDRLGFRITNSFKQNGGNLRAR